MMEAYKTFSFVLIACGGLDSVNFYDFMCKFQWDTRVLLLMVVSL